MARRLSRSRMIMYSIVGVVLLVVTGGATWFVINTYFGADSESTEVRSQAASATGTVQLIMETDETTRYVKDAFPVDLYLDTGSETISALAFQLRYNSGAAATPNLQVVDGDNNLANGVQIISEVADIDGCFATQVNQVQRENKAGDKNVFIDFAVICNNQTGFSTTDTGRVRIGRIVFLANAPGEVLLEHDVTKAKATAKSGENAGQDVLRTVPNMGVTIQADSEKPVVAFTQGIEEGATSTSSAVQFTAEATEKPDRPEDLIKYPDFLQYRFSKNNRNWTAWQNSGVYKDTNPIHGAQSLYVQAKDPNNNISDSLQRSFTLDLRPTITSLETASAAGGEELVINGYNFGPRKTYVYFGSVLVQGNAIPEWTDNLIRVRVPANGNGGVRVRTTSYGLTGTNQFSEVAEFQVETRLAVAFNFRAFEQDRGPREVDISVEHPRYETVTFENQTANWSEEDGAYVVTTDSLPGTFTPTSGYIVKIKGPNTLRRAYRNLTLRKGQLNAIVKKANFADKLVAGDINNDNIIDISDFGRMMTYVTSLSTPVSTAGDGADLADLNGDGNITFQDVGLLLSNYTQLQVQGE